MSHQVQNPGQVVDMPVIEANGILFDFEQCGDPNGEPVLLWMGLGAQRTMWPTVLVQQLASKGFFVTSFDNRDSGLSGHLDNLGTVGLGSFCCIGCYVYCCCLGCNQLLPNPAPYALDDMVTDVVALVQLFALSALFPVFIDPTILFCSWMH
jgi:pimeloyl-ACP methyl ester carboxylesterase